VAPSYVPDAGDIVWLQFDPQAGHRPAVVLSPASYSGRVTRHDVDWTSERAYAV
jgi:mRNA interferase MazF